MQPRQRTCQRPWEEPEDEGASGIQAQYRKDDHRPQQVLATARQPFVIQPHHFADDGKLYKAVGHSNLGTPLKRARPFLRCPPELSPESLGRSRLSAHLSIWPWYLR